MRKRDAATYAVALLLTLSAFALTGLLAWVSHYTELLGMPLTIAGIVLFFAVIVFAVVTA